MKKFVILVVITIGVLIGTITIADARTPESNINVGVRYTTVSLKSGDTLSELAKRSWDSDKNLNKSRWHSYKDMLDEICTASGIKNPDYVQTGTMISVPYLVTESGK